MSDTRAAEVLRNANLASEVVTASDGHPSIVMRSNDEAAEIAVQALSSHGLLVVEAEDELTEAEAQILLNPQGCDGTGRCLDCRELAVKAEAKLARQISRLSGGQHGS